MKCKKRMKKIEMTYIPSEDNKKEKFRMFGNNFVFNNQQKCKIIYKDNNYNLTEFFDNIDSEYNKKRPIYFYIKRN